MSDTDDIESTGADKTGAIRKVRSQLEKEQWLREREQEEDKRRDKALYALREEHKKLKEGLYDPKDGIITGLRNELAEIRQVIAFLKWAGGIIGGLIITGLAAALFGG